MQKILTTLLILVMIASISADTVKVSDACACDKIKVENDCKARATCEWKVTTTPGTGGAPGIINY